MLILLRMLTTRFAPCELRASIRQLELLQIAFHRPPGPPSPRQVARGKQAVGFNEEPHSFNDSRPGDHPRCSSSVFSRRALRLDDRQTRQGGGGEAAPTGETRQTRDTHTKIR